MPPVAASGAAGYKKTELSRLLEEFFVSDNTIVGKVG
jgi:hypothetical protein